MVENPGQPIIAQTRAAGRFTQIDLGSLSLISICLIFKILPSLSLLLS